MARTRGGPQLVLAVVLAMLPAVVLGQSSTSYTVSDHNFNAGGHPAGGQIPSSASYRLTLDVIGPSAGGDLMLGSSYQAAGGFTPAYLPPGEVAALEFGNAETLLWAAEPTIGSYNVYRDDLNSLPAYGGCWREDLTSTTTIDTDSPALGQGFFYLVTAVNRLSEEGTRGFDSQGSERTTGATCP